MYMYIYKIRNSERIKFKICLFKLDPFKLKKAESYVRHVHLEDHNQGD